MSFQDFHKEAMIFAQEAIYYKNNQNDAKFKEFSAKAYDYEEKAIESYPKDRLGDYTWYVYFRGLLYLGLDAKKYDEVKKKIDENNHFIKDKSLRQELDSIRQKNDQLILNSLQSEDIQKHLSSKKIDRTKTLKEIYRNCTTTDNEIILRPYSHLKHTIEVIFSSINYIEYHLISFRTGTIKNENSKTRHNRINRSNSHQFLIISTNENKIIKSKVLMRFFKLPDVFFKTRKYFINLDNIISLDLSNQTIQFIDDSTLKISSSNDFSNLLVLCKPLGKEIFGKIEKVDLIKK